MSISQPKETINLKINNKEDLDKISNMKLDLHLPQDQQKKIQPGKMPKKTEPLLVCELTAKVYKVIPIKEANVEVNLITTTVIKQKNPPLW